MPLLRGHNVQEVPHEAQQVAAERMNPQDQGGGDGGLPDNDALMRGEAGVGGQDEVAGRMGGGGGGKQKLYHERINGTLCRHDLK